MTEDEKPSYESILQSLKEQSKLSSHLSPYLSAIQSINGQTPGEKYKELNIIIKKIIDRNEEYKGEILDLQKDIPTSIVPLVQIIIGEKFKSNDAIIEALKSEDVTIVHHALKAKWFFNGTNPLIDVNYFLPNIILQVPVKTRFKIIKILSSSLIGHEKKAEDFFESLTDSYSIQVAMPLLPACSGIFISEIIMTPKPVLKLKDVFALYKRHPALIVQYLKLGKLNNDDRKEKKKINVPDEIYENFLPHLIRHDTNTFLELLDECIYRSVGSTLTRIFFKSAAEAVIQEPNRFLHIWPMKIISKRLTNKQFEKMFPNLFPPKILNKRNLIEIVEYLKYYPQEKRMDLLNKCYKLTYSKEFSEMSYVLDSNSDLQVIKDVLPVEVFEKFVIKRFFSQKSSCNINSILVVLKNYTEDKQLQFLTSNYKKYFNKDFFDDIDEQTLRSVSKLLSSEERRKQAYKIVNTFQKNSSDYYKWYVYVPPEESFAIFQEAVNKTSDVDSRCCYLQKMVESCAIYKNYDYLLQFLNYYNMRHKNERSNVLNAILTTIRESFNFKLFERTHWQEFREIIQRAHSKDELEGNLLQFFCTSAIYFLLVKCKNNSEEITKEEDIAFLKSIFTMTLDYNKNNYFTSKWNFLEDYPSINRYCLNEMLNLIPIRYPPKDHAQSFIQNYLKAIKYFNDNIKKIKDSNIANAIEPIAISSYPWLMEMLKTKLQSSTESCYFRKIIKDLHPNLLSILIHDYIDDIDLSHDVKSGAGWINLKKHQNIVLANWNHYLCECRERLAKNSKGGGPASRRFLLTAKWHNDLPIKFIDRCLQEIEENGSMKVLGILLEGQVFSKIVTPCVPKESALDVYSNDAKNYYKIVKSIPPAIVFTNPPVSLDFIGFFCQGDYTKLSIQAIDSTSLRVSKSKILDFAKSLVQKPVSVKKHGLRLYFKTSSKIELRDFVKTIWTRHSHPSIRELLANMVFDRFVATPNQDNWELITICISGLRSTDEVPISIFSRVNEIKNVYTPEYLMRLIEKVEEFKDDELKNISKDQILSDILSNIHEEVIKLFPEETILSLLDKYYFCTDSKDIKNAAAEFAMLVFNSPFQKLEDD